MTKRDFEFFLAKELELQNPAGEERLSREEKEKRELGKLRTEVAEVLDQLKASGLNITDRIIIDALRTYFIGSRFGKRLEVAYSYPALPPDGLIDFEPFVVAVKAEGNMFSGRKFKVLVGRMSIAEEAARKRLKNR